MRTPIPSGLPSIGPATLQLLRNAGFHTAYDLISKDPKWSFPNDFQTQWGQTELPTTWRDNARLYELIDYRHSHFIATDLCDALETRMPPSFSRREGTVFPDVHGMGEARWGVVYRWAHQQKSDVSEFCADVISQIVMAHTRSVEIADLLARTGGYIAAKFDNFKPASTHLAQVSAAVAEELARRIAVERSDASQQCETAQEEWGRLQRFLDSDRYVNERLMKALGALHSFRDVLVAEAKREFDRRMLYRSALRTLVALLCITSVLAYGTRSCVYWCRDTNALRGNDPPAGGSFLFHQYENTPTEILWGGSWWRGRIIVNHGDGTATVAYDPVGVDSFGRPRTYPNERVPVTRLRQIRTIPSSDSGVTSDSSVMPTSLPPSGGGRNSSTRIRQRR